jgi:hypothetical protein
MKTPTQYLKVFGVIFFATMVLAACANKDDNSNRAAGRESEVAVNGGINPETNSQCSNTNMEWGKIYDANGSVNFEAQVKGFVSATLNPESLGTISGNISNPTTGVDFNGSFSFDQDGNLVPDKSTLTIKIFDSYVNQVYNGQVIQPYVVQFSKASEGYLNRSTGQLRVTFQDSYGSIVFDGRMSGANVDGQVTYDNKVAVDGLSPSSGVLGSFIAYSCSMIK